jgi:hypothetical protein
LIGKNLFHVHNLPPVDIIVSFIIFVNRKAISSASSS